MFSKTKCSIACCYVRFDVFLWAVVCWGGGGGRVNTAPCCCSSGLDFCLWCRLGVCFSRHLNIVIFFTFFLFSLYGFIVCVVCRIFYLSVVYFKPFFRRFYFRMFKNAVPLV